jgi:hypothetical protein
MWGGRPVRPPGGAREMSGVSIRTARGLCSSLFTAHHPIGGQLEEAQYGTR